MEEIEIWKPIKNHSGYFVSNLGRVKSFKKNREIILRQSKRNIQGYLAVCLWSDDAKKSTHSIHILVAEAFLDHIIDGHTITVDHIDNVKSNNKSDNLQLLSSRANVSKNARKGTSKYTGVHWSKSMHRWKACIEINRIKNILGYFYDEIEAAKAYQVALANL